MINTQEKTEPHTWHRREYREELGVRNEERGVAVTLVATGIKGSLGQLGMFWDAGGEWSREREGARLGVIVL